MKAGLYQAFSPSEKYHTGKYVLKNGTTSTLSKFKNKSPSAKESTDWSISQKYEEELGKTTTEKRDPSNSLTPAP